ncbi:MAG TPA: TetR/AcrR family transcriptional regulator [Acidimicrobiales bacterium]|nr:TetR/AcrR family transcriptional regulator [Acidimicrobiales bacterium]
MAHVVPKVEGVDAMGAPDVPSAGPAHRCDPRVERTRQAALGAARAILEEQGWEAVTHVAVSERSGVGRSTLYRHWPDAAALVIEAIAEQAILDVPVPTGNLRADLVAELERFRLRLLDPACERAMVTVMERAAVDPDFAEVRASVTSDATKPMRATLTAAGARGELDIGAGVDVLVAQLAGPLAFRRLFARQPLTRRFVVQVVDSVLAAHGRPGSAPGPRA